MTQSILAQKVRYSTRNTRGRYLQRLLLDTARCLAPTLTGSWREFERATLHVAGDAARLELKDKQALQADPSLTATQIDILNVMGAALTRQINRLTGATAFELATWHNTLLTQPVEICLITAAGRRLRLFNPSFSANRYFHAIVALSEALEAHYGLQARQPQDLDALIDAGHLEGWIVDPVADAEIATEALVLDWSPTSLARARAEFGASDLPESLVLIEEYEAALATGTVRHTSQWGQEGEGAATRRTKKRRERLNPRLTADLVPLSRSLKEISIEELKSLADERPLSHLAIEFGVSDKALSKRLQKAGWISPRAKMRAMR